MELLDLVSISGRGLGCVVHGETHQSLGKHCESALIAFYSGLSKILRSATSRRDAVAVQLPPVLFGFPLHCWAQARALALGAREGAVYARSPMRQQDKAVTP
jgi:hypothetical protein